MPSSEPVAYLVDASPYVFRAFFSLPDSIRDQEDRPVHAVYGFVSFLVKLIAEEEPSHLAVAFDRSLTTSFRNEIYPEYKAGRTLPPAELEAQLDDCLEAAAALGAATFVDEAYEADDLLAALVDSIDGAGCRAVVVTSDKDLAQLVTERVGLYDFAKDERLGPAEVVERLGVRPEQVADLLALAGDPVDNIPGVAGIGKKSATALLAAFGDLDTLYERLDEVPGLDLHQARACRRRLEEGREQAYLSRRLAVVARDAPARVGLEALVYRGADRAAVEALFDRLGFDTLRERIPRWADGGGPGP